MKKTVLNLLSVSFIGLALGRVFDYGINVVIAQRLGPGGLGVFALGFVVINIISNLTKLGLDNMAMKNIPAYIDQNDDGRLLGFVVFALITPFVVSLLVIMPLYYNPGIIHDIFNIRFREDLLIFLFAVPLYATVQVGVKITRGFKETKYGVYIDDISRSGVALFLIFIGLYLFPDIISVFYAYLAALLIANLIMIVFIYYLIRTECDGLPVITLSPLHVLRDSPSFFGVNIFNYLTFWNGIVLLAIFKSTEQMGLFQATLHTTLSLTVVLLVFNSIFPSIASDYYQKSLMSKLEEIYNGLSRWAFNLSLIGSVLLIVFSREILLIFGGQFANSMTILRIMTLGVFLYTSFGLAGQLLLMTNHERLALFNTILSTLLSIMLNIFLIPRYGILGAAIATSFSLGLIGLLQVIEIQKLFGFEPYYHLKWRDIVGIAIGGVFAFATSHLVTGLLPTLLVGGISMLVPIAVLFTYIGPDKFDKSIREAV